MTFIKEANSDKEVKIVKNGIPSSNLSHTFYRLHKNIQALPCSIEILTYQTSSSSVQKTYIIANISNHFRIKLLTEIKLSSIGQHFCRNLKRMITLRSCWYFSEWRLTAPLMQLSKDRTPHLNCMITIPAITGRKQNHAM